MILGDKRNDQLGYQYLPMLPDIKHDKFVIDLLHMFIRIGQVLIDLLVDALTFADGIGSELTKYFSNKHKKTALFADFLHNECNQNKINDGLNLKELRIAFKQNLTGSSLRNIFKKNSEINISSILGTEFEKPSSLWLKFWEIDILLRSNQDYTPEFLENRTKEFHHLFTTTYHFSKMTPYLHFFCFHLHDSYKNVGNLEYFSSQGLEKLNDLSTYQFFGGTNKHKNFIKQILEKDFRMLFLDEKFGEDYSKTNRKNIHKALILERNRRNRELPVVKFDIFSNGTTIEGEKNLGTENGGYFFWAIRSGQIKKIKYKIRSQSGI